VGTTLIAGVPQQRALDLLDISEPDNPKEGVSVLFPYFPLASTTTGDYLYVTLASSERRMDVVDISNPLEPRVVGSQVGVGNIALVAGGAHLYALSEEGLQVLDVSEPGRPREG
jgi:hypothetical protein